MLSRVWFRSVADLNGRELDGRPLKVELAKPKVGGDRDSGYARRGNGGSWR